MRKLTRHLFMMKSLGRHGCDRMVVGFKQLPMQSFPITTDVKL
jgi:hypothetical protein